MAQRRDRVIELRDGQSCTLGHGELNNQPGSWILTLLLGRSALGLFNGPEYGEYWLKGPAGNAVLVPSGHGLDLGRNHELLMGADSSVSRRHAQLYIDNEGNATITDLFSTNRTRVSVPEVVEMAPALTLGRPGPDRFARKYSVSELEDFVMSDPRNPSVARELVQHEIFRPSRSIECDGRQVHVSDMFELTGRAHAVIYVPDDMGRILPRMAYKSISDGGWRVAPFVMAYPKFLYSKGDIKVPASVRGDSGDYGAYVQATKPVESLAAGLREIEGLEDFRDENVSVEDLVNFFGIHRQFEPNMGELFEHSVKCVAAIGKGMDVYTPGDDLLESRDKIMQTELPSMEMPDGFMPDFSAGCERSYVIEHTLLGRAVVRMYPAQLDGRGLHWHVADDGQGNIWVDRLIFDDAKMNSFGVYDSIILAGAVNAKPVDYSELLQPGMPSELTTPIDDTYSSLQQIIGLMPWARAYRAARCGSGW